MWRRQKARIVQVRIGGIYSFNAGHEVIVERCPAELLEVREIVSAVDASTLQTKTSAEKTMPGRMLYSPSALNRAFKREFRAREWDVDRRIYCDYPTQFYTDDYTPPEAVKGAFREMDFVKNKVGVEVQFGKYAFMVYNVAAKMTIFHNHEIIDVGVEIVPLKELADQMSTGVSYFEQFVWDLEQRGVADIDIPVLVLGVIP
jgi:hypothetical protein